MYLKQILKRAGPIVTENLQFQLKKSLYDIEALELLPDLDIGYVPWSSFSIRPSALIMALNEIVMNNCRVIIECGIGISTLFMLGSGISKDIRVIGIDDDSNWIAIIKSLLDQMKISQDQYTLIHAPIRQYEKSIVGHMWYDVAHINNGLQSIGGNVTADMLIVDGPKNSLCTMSRYQALPRLHQYLSNDFTVFLDDIHRKNETSIAKMWADTFGLSLEYHRERGGVAVLRPQGTAKTMIIS